MLALFLIFAVVAFSLTVLLWAGTLGFQGLIYNEPAGQLQWRAPATGVALTAFLALWCVLNFRSIDPAEIDLPYDTLFHFSPRETKYIDQLWVVRDVSKDGKTVEEETPFKRKKTELRGVSDYRDALDNPYRREDSKGIAKAIIVKEGDQKIRFEPHLSKDGKFLPNAEQFPGYYEVRGRRTMEQLGQVTVFHRGLWVVNIFLNLLHFGIWFVCLWLLLRFQWSHALGLAVALWLVMTLVPIPMLLDKTRDVVKQRAGMGPRAAAATPTDCIPRARHKDAMCWPGCA